MRGLEGGPRPLAAASALEDLGCALVASGRAEEGVAVLDRAFDLYARCGAAWDLRRVRGRLRRLGVRRRLGPVERPAHGWAALTPTELEVVRLVGRGLTNRAAAERLYISPHTVSTHLRKVFAKLAINSRVELARLLATRDAG